jgi:hypothetical protein
VAGATIPIREILQAREKHRRDLDATVRNQRRTVDELMEIKRGDATINRKAKEKSPTWDSASVRPGLWAGDPLALSVKIRLQPALLSASRCRDKF